jgi:hypothetical protein
MWFAVTIATPSAVVNAVCGVLSISQLLLLLLSANSEHAP